MKQKCSVCGREFNEQLMESFFTGRKTEWYCWDCWKKSQYEANKSDLSRQKKLYQIHKSKRRNK